MIRAALPDRSLRAVQPVTTQRWPLSRKVQPSSPERNARWLRSLAGRASSKRRSVAVDRKPRPWAPPWNVRWARVTLYEVSGSTSAWLRVPPRSMSAISRAVTACSTPRFQSPAILPVSLAAPRMRVPEGTSA